MKRLLFVVLITVCSVSWAGWERIGTSDEGGLTVYVDTSTIRKNGAISRMWFVDNCSKVQTNPIGDRYMSDKSLRAFNCRDETFAIISLVRYSGSMGQGNVVRSATFQERELEWSPIVPETVGETKWKIACGKK